MQCWKSVLCAVLSELSRQERSAALEGLDALEEAQAAGAVLLSTLRMPQLFPEVITIVSYGAITTRLISKSTLRLGQNTQHS